MLLLHLEKRKHNAKKNVTIGKTNLPVTAEVRMFHLSVNPKKWSHANLRALIHNRVCQNNRA